MSYCRLPYYIYPTGDGVSFTASHSEISNEEIDIFLYDMFSKGRQDELIQRLKHGKQLIINFETSKLDDTEKQEMIKYFKEHNDTNKSDEEIIRMVDTFCPEVNKQEAEFNLKYIHESESDLYIELTEEDK